MADIYPTRRNDAAQDSINRHDNTHGDAPPAASGFGLLANVAGAVVSVGLVIGIGVWGYKLLVRDVTGVPVVQATAGPMRVAPQEPGGDSARHQGLAVNDVAGVGAAGAPADRLVLAPRVAQLSDEDMPAAILAALPRYDPLPADAPDAQAAELRTADAGAGDEALPDSGPAGDDAGPQVASIRALADQIAQGAVALEPETTDTAASDAVEADEAAPEAVVITASATVAPRTVKGGIARSLRPRKRPQVVPAAAAVAAPATTQVAAAVVAPEAVPAGTRLAQLGAFDSADVAEKEWQRLNARFGDYLEGKSRVIQRANSGGRTFYRLRAMGFADIDDARRFCSALVAEKADCIPVVTR